MMKNIVTSIIIALRDRSPKTGLYFHNQPGRSGFVSYPALYRQIVHVMRQFHTAGIGAGSRVILPFATSIESVAAFFALIGTGALPLSVKVPTSGSSRDGYHEFLQNLIQRFGSVSIVATPAMTISLAGVPQVQVSLAPLDTDSEMNDVVWDVPGPDDIAFVQFSSGTTGQQKGVPIRHGQLIRQLEFILNQDDRSATDIGASWLPLYHDMGLVGALLSSMLSGHSLHLDSPASFLMHPLDWLASLSTHRVSITALPNFGLSYLLNHVDEADAEELAGCRLDALRRIYVGSDAIDAVVINRLIQLLQPLGLSAKAMTPCYGMAEAVLMVSCKPVEDSLRLSKIGNQQNIVSVGKILPEFEVRILSESASPCAANESGEILIRGGTLTESYFEDACTILDADGFYHSGDLGYLQDGHLYITGRIGDRIKVNGENYFLPHLENHIHSHPELRPGGVAVIQSSGTLFLLAEPRRMNITDHLDALRTELTDLVTSAIGIKIPREQIFFVKRNQLKRTSSGKLQRSLVQHSFEHREMEFVNGNDRLIAK